VVTLAFLAHPSGSRIHSAPAPPARPAIKAPSPSHVWLAEHGAGHDLYSNGLRIENDLVVAVSSWHYRAIPRRPEQSGAATWRSEPAGIVFHTSESHLASFEADQNPALRRNAQELLFYVRRHQCYHFVIDRFGRVHRIVEETGPAEHAGASVWADPDWIYLNLNSSFLGICFEAQTQPGETLPGLNPAQIHGGTVLLEMLRDRYRIPARNCVTHAQVSVNPRNFRIGYHTDWAGNFPFRELGLTDNYGLPLPSVTLFGFGYDPLFVRSTGARLWNGLLQAEEQVESEAASRGLSVARYRAMLQQNYRYY
jgi:hypothetical protein